MRNLYFAGAAVALVSLACSSKTVVTDATPDAGADTGLVDAGGGAMCTSARDTLLVPINTTSTGAVMVISDDGTTKKIYVDASAGGQLNAPKNPRVYISLGDATRVDVTDVAATSSTDWDLALKRDVLYTNSGDAGPGAGGGVEIDKGYDAITDDDARSAAVAPESFFDADCNAKKDPNSEVLTTFSNWYDYDQTTHIPSPDPNRNHVVRGATGRLFKVGILAYDALADGGSRNNAATGYYLLQVTEVTP